MEKSKQNNDGVVGDSERNADIKGEDGFNDKENNEYKEEIVSSHDNATDSGIDIFELRKKLDALAVEFVPKEYRHLIPNLPPGEKIAWINDMREAGLLYKVLDDGPGAQRPTSKKSMNLDRLSPHQMMSMGYDA